jgi:WD40 repeat protein
MVTGDQLWSPSTVKVWDVASGEEAYPPCPCEQGVKCAAFSPDGRELAAGLRGGNVKVWDARTGKEVRTLKGHAAKIEAVAYSPDGRWLLSSADRTVKVWDAHTGQEKEALRGPTNSVFQLAYGPDGTRLAARMLDTSGGFGTTVKIWDVTSGQGARVLCVHDPVSRGGQSWGEACDLAYSPDGGRLATSGIEGAVRVWDTRSGRQLFALPGQTYFQRLEIGSVNVCPVMFSPDGSRLASATDEGTVHVWDAKTGKEVRALAGYGGRVTGLAFSRDGRRLAAGGLRSLGAAPPVKVWEMDTGREVASLDCRFGEARVVMFSPDGQRLLVGDANPSLAVPQQVPPKQGQDRGPPWKCWDLATGKEVPYLEAPPADARCAAYSPDDRWLATNGEPGEILFWDAATGKRAKALKGHRTHVQSVAFSRDGNRLASASDDVEVKLWDTSTARELLSSREPTFQVWDEIYRPRVAIRPDGNQLAWCGYDGAVRAWDAEEVPVEARQAATLTWHRFETGDADKARHWFAAAFHLSRLIDAEPDNAPYHVRRARAHAESGWWDEAAADLARAMELEPDDQGLYYQTALVRLQTGDLAGYRAGCADTLRRFGQTRDPVVANSVAWDCALGPDAVADWPPVVRLAEQAAAARPGDNATLNTLGACLYRAGQLGPAVEKLDAAVKAQRWGGTPADWLFLAMAHQRLGHPEEAKHWLDQAARRLNDLDPENPAPGVALALSWEQRLELRLLHREAEALIRGQAAGPRP